MSSRSKDNIFQHYMDKLCLATFNSWMVGWIQKGDRANLYSYHSRRSFVKVPLDHNELLNIIFCVRLQHGNIYMVCFFLNVRILSNVTCILKGYSTKYIYFLSAVLKSYSLSFCCGTSDSLMYATTTSRQRFY